MTTMTVVGIVELLKSGEQHTFSSPLENKYRGPLPVASKNKFGAWLAFSVAVLQTLDIILGGHSHDETNIMRSHGWLQATTHVRKTVIKNPPNKVCLHFGPLKNTNRCWGHR